MKIEVKRYSEEKYGTWNEFVKNSNNGTLFHRLDFLDYHPDGRFDERPLMFYYKGQNLVGVMPLAIMEENERTIAKSPYGGSFGGVVMEYDLKFRYAEELVSVLIQYLRDEGIDEIVVRPTPREQHVSPSCYMEFHYYNNGFEIVDREVTNVVDLDRVDDDPFEIYDRSCRNKVRKAQKNNIEVEEWSNDWESFHQLLRETWERHNKTPTHTLRELKDLSERFPERVKLCMAYYNEVPVAGIAQFLINGVSNFHFYNCHNQEYQDMAPVNILIDNEIRWSIENGFRYFDFGTTVENAEWSDGLMTFKESFGATGHFRDVSKLVL